MKNLYFISILSCIIFLNSCGCGDSFTFQNALDNCNNVSVCINPAALQAHVVSGQIKIGDPRGRLSENCISVYEGKAAAKISYFIRVPCERISIFNLPDHPYNGNPINDVTVEYKLFKGNNEIPFSSAVTNTIMTDLSGATENVQTLTEDHMIAKCNPSTGEIECGSQVFLGISFPASQINTGAFNVVFYVDGDLDHQHDNIAIDHDQSRVSGNCIVDNATNFSHYEYIKDSGNCGHIADHMSIIGLPICPLDINDTTVSSEEGLNGEPQG